MYPTLNFKCLTTGFGAKSVCIAYKNTNLIVPFSKQDLPLISTFGNFALTKRSFKLLLLRNPATGVSWKTFLCSWSGVRRICNSRKMFLTFSYIFL